MAGQSLFVGTKDICFFCLKETDLKNTGWDSMSSAASNSKLFRFKKSCLSRYLELSYKQIFNFNVSASILQNSDLIVPLCQKCSVVTEGFEKLCKEADAIRLKLDGYVQKVHDLMMESEQDKARVQKAMKRLTAGKNASDLFNASVMQNLRMEAIDKCGKKMNTMVPRVKVTRLTTEETKGLGSGQTGKGAVKGVLCSFCHATFHSQKSLDSHMPIFHPEQLFLNYRDPSISVSIFRRIMIDLLFQDVEASAKSMSCPYCEIGFECPDKDAEKVIKLHAVQKHYDLLCEKLTILQRDPKLIDVLSSCNPEGQTCPECGLYQKNGSSFAVHRRRHCEPSIAKSLQVKVSCPFCQLKVNRKSLNRHKKNCKKKGGIGLKSIPAKRSLPTVTPVSCKKCGVRMFPEFLKIHMKAGCGGKSNSSKSRNKKRRNPSQPMPGQKVACQFCGDLIHPCSRNRHLKNHCKGKGTNADIMSLAQMNQGIKAVATKKTSGKKQTTAEEPKVECTGCGEWLLLYQMFSHKWQCPGNETGGGLSMSLWNGTEMSLCNNGIGGSDEDPMIEMEYENSAEVGIGGSSQEDGDFPLAMLAVEMNEEVGENNYSPETQMDSDYARETKVNEVIYDVGEEIIETETNPIQVSNSLLNESSLTEMEGRDPLMETESESLDLLSSVAQSLPEGVTTTEEDIQSAFDKILELESKTESKSNTIQCRFCEVEVVLLSELKGHVLDKHFNDTVSKISEFLCKNRNEKPPHVKQEVLDGS